MKIFNSMSRQKEDFVPIEPGKVRMYACGPTVYNLIHVGNARPIILFDVLRRYLEYRGYDVTFVQNFTDVDDKIINRANEEGITSQAVAEKYIQEYFTDAQGLGVRPATIHPTGGVTAIGARMPLIAYNINLDTPNVEIASAIAKTIRNMNGGFRYCKAMGVHLEDRNLAQVSMNLTDFTQSAMYRVFETVKMEARRYGVNVLGSEIVGLVPQQALLDCAAYYLQLEGFNGDQVLENRL